MWEPRPLATLWASTACNRDITLSFLLDRTNHIDYAQMGPASRIFHRQEDRANRIVWRCSVTRPRSDYSSISLHEYVYMLYCLIWLCSSIAVDKYMDMLGKGHGLHCEGSRRTVINLQRRSLLLGVFPLIRYLLVATPTPDRLPQLPSTVFTSDNTEHRQWQLHKTLPTFYGNRTFIIVFSVPYHESTESNPHPNLTYQF
jgi:hypothetical protein